MISKNAIYLLFSILTACTMEGGKDISNQSTANRQISQTKTDPHVPSCVRSEGGYETSTYCITCLLYTSPSPRDQRGSRMPSSA